MTNEVENLILEREKNNRNMNFSEKNSYLLYREIWNFILNTEKYNPNYFLITICFHICNKDISISHATDIVYELKDYKSSSKWVGYYENCDNYKIRNLINTVIDFQTLLNLLRTDDFVLSKEIKKEQIILKMIINKAKINTIKSNILQKNGKIKKLNKED